MKQNGQWLSHVRHPVEHRARRARGRAARPSAFSTTTEPLEPAAAHLELDARPVGLQLVRDDVAQIARR